jgi:hypothetical protein
VESAVNVTNSVSNLHLDSKTAETSADMKSKLLRRTKGREQDHYDDEDGGSEPADSIMDSDSEGEEDTEVDGMLG